MKVVLTECFEDVIDILDYDEAEIGEANDILDQYNQDFDFDYIHSNVDDEEMVMEDPHHMADNDHVKKKTNSHENSISILLL